MTRKAAAVEPAVEIMIKYTVELQYVIEADAMEEVMDKLRELGSAEVTDVRVVGDNPPKVAESVYRSIRQA